MYNSIEIKGNYTLKKFCVFCGNTPENKNKEHVLPQWLSKYTGRYHSICEMGDITNAKIPFCALTFPACTKCNEEFGRMEAAVKPILMDLVESKPLNASQISLLLDWFDKIRVGLWLSELTLAKQVDKIEPKFHIADRVGIKDRVLIIERIKDAGQGLSFIGTDAPLFYEMPSAFALVVNDFVFINASEIGLVSNRLGFPQVGKMKMTQNRYQQIMELSSGRNKTAHPVVSDIQASPNRTIVYQPMYRWYPAFAETPQFQVPYVLNHSLDYANGVGGIFYQRGDNQIKYLSGDGSVSLAPRPQDMSRMPDLCADVFKLQSYVLTSRTDIDSYTKIGSAFWRKLLMQNQVLQAQSKKIQFQRQK